MAKRVPTQVLALSSTTTPALDTTAGGHSSSGGINYGRSQLTLVLISATRAAGTMSGVTFTVWGSRTGAAGTWVQLPVYKSSDTGKTLAASVSLSPGDNLTLYEGLVCDAAMGWPSLDVRGLAVGAAAGAGDSCAAYLVSDY